MRNLARAWGVAVACVVAGCGSPSGGGGGDLAAAGAADLATGMGGFRFEEHFAAADGAPWPSAWRLLGGAAAWTVQGGRGRLVPMTSSYSLARMAATEMQRDVDVTFVARFEDVATQGIGLYVRQNGGRLQSTTPHGTGYAVFIEGFRGARVGVWREVDGAEMEILASSQLTLVSNKDYGVRLRVAQMAATMTHLQARVWDAAQAEPSTWQLDTTDATPSLEGVAGGFAVDSYSSATAGTLTAGTLVDDLVIVAAP